MKLATPVADIAVDPASAEAYQATLTAPLDDMYAFLAGAAEGRALVVDDHVVGVCTVDDESQIRHFFLQLGFSDLADEVFGLLVDRLRIVAAVPSSVDQGFTAVSLERGQASEVIALMYAHGHEPVVEPLTDMRLAVEGDHEAAVAFSVAATGDPETFLRPYLKDRIAGGEVLFHEVEDRIVAVGECRLDSRSHGYSQLGVIVGRDHRGQGLGSQVMSLLVAESRDRGLTPLCSTSPDNSAAQLAIERAGFEAYHQVLRVQM